MSAERFFDDLARTLAEPMPRRRAVRVVGASLAAIAVPGVGSSVARAATTRFEMCPPTSGRRQCWTAPDWVPGRPEAQPYCCKFPSQQWSCGDAANGYACKNHCPRANPVLRKKQQPTWSTVTYPDGSPQRYNCCPVPDFIPRDGECLPSCAFTHGPGTYQCGEDCCGDSQYCCDRIFTFRDPFCCGPEEAFKEPYQDAEIAATIAVVALGALAVAAGLATGGLAAIAFAGLGAGAGLGGIAAKIAGDDPPDPRYKELFRPRVPRVASVRPGDGVTPAAARALDRLIANRLRAGAFILAWIRSIEKAQGADKARDKTWAQRHRKAAAGYAREAAATLGRDNSLSTVALRELKRGGFVDTGVTLVQARQWQQLVRRRGLPAETTRVLRAAGVDDARIAGFRTAVSRLDTKLVAGVGVFGSLTDKRLAAANTATIKALRRAARA